MAVYSQMLFVLENLQRDPHKHWLNPAAWRSDKMSRGWYESDHFAKTADLI